MFLNALVTVLLVVPQSVLENITRSGYPALKGPSITSTCHKHDYTEEEPKTNHTNTRNRRNRDVDFFSRFNELELVQHKYF